MKERPILFSGPMVRAILAGTKTQTRRLVRVDDTPVIIGDGPNARLPRQRGFPTNAMNVRHLGPYAKCDAPPGSNTVSSRVPCPYGTYLDRLWVRETWKESAYSCDQDHQPETHECGEHCSQKYVYYAATPRIGYRPIPDKARIRYLDDSSPLTDWYTSGWRSPRFMPRWASRITLEITDVRVERLQSISDEDARAEGVDVVQNCPFGRTARREFQDLWDSINGKRAPWSSNPWVWALTFRRVTP